MESTNKENMSKMQKFMDKLNGSHSKLRRDEERPLIRQASKMDLDPVYLPTGIDVLDKILGGGVTVEGITAIHGTHFTGKTALALTIASRLTNAGRNVLYVYTETPPPYALIGRLGVNTDHLFMVGPQDYAEQMIDAIEAILWDSKSNKPSGLVDLVIIDSINNFVGKKEVTALEKNGAEAETMAIRAKCIDAFQRRILGRGLLEKTKDSPGCAVIMIVQNRAVFGAQHAYDDISAGFSVKYNPKQLISLRKKNFSGDKKYLGHTILVNVSKNAVLGYPGTTEYSVMYDSGVDDSEALVEKGTDWGYIISDKDAGRGWFRVIIPSITDDGDLLIKGKANLSLVFRSRPDIKQTLRDLYAIGKPKVAPLPSKNVREVIDPKEEISIEE